ncbi:DUF2058 domain-containing protein [Marinomonas balearica]|uniref:Nucleoprotein/polynucleotide-associated enzyme n=1 Tax=Marinomonas balearica TaxID=491947 RepID=A0A4R6M561_9GAMM|nr:DUF2058 domain-containing protein [Marinomonas balearica]TDO96457.1 hypothetical protein DFP79_3032 [Marinomonas balearica]
MAGKSLQEQLLGAGIVDKKKAKKIKAEKLQNKQKAKKGQLDTRAEEERKQELQRQKEEKIAKDKQLNLERQKELEKKAVAGQIRQMILTNKVDKQDGDVAYNFTDNKLVKKMYLSDAMHKDLSEGRLSLLVVEGEYVLAPAAVGEKIAEKDESYVLVLNTKSEEILDEDDPYAEFVIPDDLMW